MEDGMEDFLYGMEWKISGTEWNDMEDVACYGMEDGGFTLHYIT